ncbi:winged helix-turn-helix transcriptional regulator [Streptomyces microflavus]|uniref:winged helix-turn-helix transcriptional regulator n=1 Tax=Streptomyces microflavus TaxID=1919 RepID=UPI0033AE9C36
MSTTSLPECGVARFLTLLGGPWATLIVRELLHGPHRFTELRDALPGISPHTLTSRLRQFEATGIVTRTAYAEIPPRVEYRLTPLGEGLRGVLDAMAAWGVTVPEPPQVQTAPSATNPQMSTARIASSGQTNRRYLS